jgi:signal transduction histidine kinase/HD-like signal output (HDOD) protein
MPPSRANIIHDLKVNRLPALPQVLVEMLHACENNQNTFQDLSLIINRDAAIASRVIFLANSTFYSRGTKINTLERALFLLGTDTLKTLVITAAIQQFFSSFRISQADFLVPFWQRSLTCALLAKALAILTSYPNPDEAYLTGLLHNIGELVLESNHPGFYHEAKAYLQTPVLSDKAQLDIELTRFNFHHTQVGACLAEEWGLSTFTCDAIEFHHADIVHLEDAHHLVKLIFLASYLSHPDKHFLDAHDNIAHRLFELNASLVNEIVLRIESEVKEISGSLGIHLTTNGHDNKPADTVQTDQQAHLRLARQVRNLSLIQNAMGDVSRAENKGDLSQALMNALTWLYGLNQSAVFWYSQEQHALFFEHPDSSTSLPLKIKLEAHRSLLTQAVLEKRLLSSLSDRQAGDPLTVIDAQIKNLLQCESFICIPVEDRHGPICVLVARYDQPLDKADSLRQFISFFAHEAALACRRSLNQLTQQAQWMHQASIAENYSPFDEERLDKRVHEVIHEANNPLNIINNYLHSLGQRINRQEGFDSAEISKELNIVREEVLRTSQILLQLKDLQQEVIESRPDVDMNKEIRSLCTIYKTSLFLIKHITCQLDLDPHLTSVNISRNAFKQILTNLLRNAVEALPDHGKITLSTNAHVNVNGQDYVEFCVSDNGPGIPQAILKNLFKPLVSTKGNGHSGLGLSITKNLVKDAKGTISCRSSENGTVFQVLFPVDH